LQLAALPCAQWWNPMQQALTQSVAGMKTAWQPPSALHCSGVVA
jgi:hypothetical protein